MIEKQSKVSVAYRTKRPSIIKQSYSKLKPAVVVVLSVVVTSDIVEDVVEKVVAVVEGAVAVVVGVIAVVSGADITAQIKTFILH